MINYTFIATYVYSLRILAWTFVTVAMWDCQTNVTYLLTYVTFR